jgi:phosphonate transport system substrate-binding protein
MKYLAGFLALLFCVNAHAEDDRLVLGVIPVYSAVETAKIWSGFAEYIESVSGLPVTIKTTRHSEGFVSGISTGEYDIIFMLNDHLVAAKDQYTAAGVPEGKKLRGAIVVDKNSNINSLEDLKGKKIAFPSPIDYVSSIQMLDILSKYKLDHKVVYLNSLSSVIIGVENGFYEAGSVLSGLYEHREALKTVFTSNELSTFVIAVSNKLSQSKAEKLINAALEAHKNSSAMNTLSTLGFNSFVPYTEPNK